MLRVVLVQMAAARRFDDAEKAHHHHDGVDLGFAVEGTDEHSFGESAKRHAHRHRDDDAPPVPNPSVDLGHADVGGEHGHRALGEVQHVRGLPDDDQAEGDE
jgi:hypothetical protein